MTNRLPDSGYGSSETTSQQRHGRKCRSTCNIVLSTCIREETEGDEQQTPDGATCARAHSLRCQTPRCHGDVYYGCGDPWCHHVITAAAPMPLVEAEERGGSSERSTTRTPSTVRCCDRCSVPRGDWWTGNGSGGGGGEKRDVSVQTYEMIDKCTSPLVPGVVEVVGDGGRRERQRYGGRRKTEPLFGNRRGDGRRKERSPCSLTPDSLEGPQVIRSARQSQANKIAPFPRKPSNERATSLTSNSGDPSSRKPKTVHIDVYCTGTEMESDSSQSSSSSSSSESRSNSTPQTVFESNRLRITHKRADQHQYPLKTLTDDLSSDNAIPARFLSGGKPVEDDLSSSAYPSKLSSYSTIRDFSSSLSSVPPSWTTMGSSLADTSWKDTFSDLDSLLQSRSSVTQTTTSCDVQPSDSFEYADTEDRARIRRLEEELWRARPNKCNLWRSPAMERKQLLQRNKIREYFERRLEQTAATATTPAGRSDSEDSDKSAKGWTFVQKPNESLTRSPSVQALAERLSLDSGLRAPFTITPGIYTDQRAIARKFGDIVPVVRKPGHHVGPVRNPDCTCDHCERYFEHLGRRGRTRSMGDAPVHNWNVLRQYRGAGNGDCAKVAPSHDIFTDF